MADFADDLRIALKLADAADAQTKARFRSDGLHVRQKPDSTPVTEADLAAERAMLDLLEAERPGEAVLSEEAGEIGSGERRWVLDPIDGTKQFLRGLPSWATLVALRDGDETVVAVVSAPALGRRWWATKGGGAFRDTGDELCVSRVERLEDAVLMHAELAAWDSVGGAARLIDLARRCWQTRAYGDFWGHCLVAEGVADICVEPGPSLWDLAAPALIVEEAGGAFTAIDGTPGPGNGSGLATNKRLHDQVVKALASIR